jgi:hypothetical protein
MLIHKEMAFQEIFILYMNLFVDNFKWIINQKIKRFYLYVKWERLLELHIGLCVILGKR